MGLIEFFHEIGSLKDLKRTGWLMRKVSNPESVADHSFRTAIFALILAPRFKLNEEKCLKMALLHDIAEARIGDIPGREKEEDQLMRDKYKKAMEKRAMQQLLAEIDDEEQADQLLTLWLELEEGVSPEAKFVKELDKLELAFQTFEYENAGRHELTLDEFYDYCNRYLHDPELKKIFEKIKGKRK
jgi:putative hydrolase of HD superfamily